MGHHSSHMDDTPIITKRVILVANDTNLKFNCKSLWNSKKSVYLRHDKGLAEWLYLENELGIQPLLNTFFFLIRETKAEGCTLM